MAAALAIVGCTPAAPPATEVALPTTPVGERAAWILDELNAPDDTRPQAWDAVLHPDFLAEVSSVEVAELVNVQLRPAAPYVVTAYEGTELEGVATLQGRLGDPFELVLVLDADELVTGMLFRPVGEAREPAASLDEAVERLEALPVDLRWLVARDGVPIAGALGDRLAPLGSIFKLWVLAAVATAVDEGALAWDDPLVVTDPVRSLPSGELQDAEEGTEVTVAEAARLMISISDNTATDLLIAAVGRDAVEAAVAASGHHEPAAMRPFPTTRELFQLLDADDALVVRWAVAGEADRRAILDELAGAPLPAVEDFDPALVRWPQGVEWFASPEDVAAVHAVLAEAGERHPEVVEALTANPGVAVPEGWASVAFKGGSSPGVLTGSWTAVGDDGSVLTIVLLASGEDAEVVAGVTAELFGLAGDLLAIEAPAS